MMQLHSFLPQIEASRQRVARFKSHIENNGDEASVQELIDAVDELSTSLEELQVADEELRQQNEELAAAQESIEAERRKYVELFEFAPAPYLVTDPAGVIEEANRSAVSMFARDCSFLLGKPITVFFRERDRRHLRDQMSGATRELEGRTWDTWLQTAESTPPIAISITIAPILGRGSFEPTGFRWLIRDLTECMRTKDRIRDLEDGLWRRVAERTARLSEENERLKLELSRIRTKVRNQPGESEEASPEPVRAGGSSRDAGRRPNSGRSPSSD